MALADLLDLVLPASCGGCGDPGVRWCPRCEGALGAALSAAPAPIVRAASGVGVPVWAGLAFEDPLRGAVNAWKDRDRRDLQPVLLRPLRAALAAAVRADPRLADAVRGEAGLSLVPVPSTRAARRRRGRAPVADLTRALAAGLPGVRHDACLRHVRRVRDQSGLDRRERAANLREALRATGPGWSAAPVLLVDDVVTTGATLTEAVRALRRAGWSPIGAVTVAAARPVGSRDA